MIKALFFDVDGVLTDGRLYIDDDGREFKVFDTKDGHGMKMALAAGLKVAWISGRTSRATAVRARELGVRHCYQGVAGQARPLRNALPALESRTVRNRRDGRRRAGRRHDAARRASPPAPPTRLPRRRRPRASS